MSNFYRRFYAVFRKPLGFLYGVKIEGAENLPDGGFVMACNHTAMMDVIVMSCATGGRQIRYMAKKELFGVPVVKNLVTALGAYPVDRGGMDVKGIKKAIEIIENKEILGIFPQGTRHQGEDPRETEIKGGIGFIAYHTKADVVPVFIDNKKKRTSMFQRNRVIIGKPITYDDMGFEKGGSSEYKAASRLVFDRVCELKYGPKETWSLDNTPSEDTEKTEK